MKLGPMRRFGVASFGIALLLGVATYLRSQTAPATPPADVFNRYCLGCHNARTAVGGFVLDPSQLSDIPGHARNMFNFLS